ncbi:MAG: hypothetical protein GXO75_14700 [Calditrichaeota bacterium]|nr:hypothetical protein [Calditrichota bacterium]
MQQLAAAYNSFDMSKSAELLNIAMNSLDAFEAADQVEIYKYAGFIAFQNGNSTLAANHFWNLLSIDPTYMLDPVTTSPKVLTLFQKTKIEFLEDMNKRLKTLQLQNTRSTPWRAVFPGWEQWRRGYRGKGTALAGAGLVALGGTIYSILKTRKRKNAYLAETNPNKIKVLYNEYNSIYKKQYTFAYALAAVWALSQVDLTLWSQPHISIKTAASFHESGGLEMSVLVHFTMLFRN